LKVTVIITLFLIKSEFWKNMVYIISIYTSLSK
jgi:hypothetical protein